MTKFRGFSCGHVLHPTRRPALTEIGLQVFMSVSWSAYFPLQMYMW